jgi:hypothetical protein
VRTRNGHTLLLKVLFASIVALCIAGYVVPTSALADLSAPPTPAHAHVAAAPRQKWFGIVTTQDGQGYRVVSHDGAVERFESSPVLTADGAVHPFGDASGFGSQVTGPVATPSPVNATSTSPPSGGVSGGDGSPSDGGSDPVSVRAVSPSGGTAGGGDTVVISGSGFTGATTVDFGSNASSESTVTSPTTITTVSPIGAGTVDVRVVTPAGTSSMVASSRFTYFPTGQLPIMASGQHLMTGGIPTVFTGFDAYQLATDFGTNTGCGSMATTAQIDSFFSSLRPNSLVRFWAFQGTMATNVHTGQLDWAPLDNVFYQAAKFHVYLIPSLSDQAGTCDGGHWQDAAWYSGGFRDVYNSASDSNGKGLAPLSYWDYMNDIVSRYADSPALGMWEPVNEAEASNCPAADQPSNCWGHQTCPDEAASAAALDNFYTAVGARIHALDPVHLVEAGFLGGGQCGTAGSDYERVGASPGIDVLSVHDYLGAVPLGGDQRNGVAVRLAQAKALDKPIVTGEAGIKAGTDQSDCVSLQQRALDMSAKMTEQFAAGASGFLVWDWLTDPLGPCSLNTGPADTSMLGAMATAPSGP